METDYKKQLELLKKTQAIDIKLHRLEVEQEELPELAESARAAFEETKAKYETTKSEHDIADEERKSLEHDISYWAKQLKKGEAKLYTLSNNREHQAATREIADIKRSNREREEKTLAIMENLEILGPEVKKLGEDLKENEKTYKEAQKKSDKRLKELKDEIAEMGKDRPALAEQIDKKILRKYEFIRQRYPDALAYIDKGVCKGCHMNILPQLYNEMLREAEFKSCPSCTRIIYIEEEKSEENPEENKPEEK